MNLPALFKSAANKFMSIKSSGASSPSEKWWTLTAPKEVLALKRQVDSWFTKHHDGALRSSESLDITPTGLSEYPDTHHYLIATAKFAEKFSGRSETYQELINLIVNGLRGLTVYSLTNPGTSRDKVRAYHGCINTTAWLLRKEGRVAKFVDEGSGLERAILQQFSESFQAVYNRKTQDGHNKQYQYLLDRLAEYRPTREEWFTSGLGETMIEVFAKIYTHMDLEQRKKLTECLDNYSYINGFKDLVRKIMQQADLAQNKVLVSDAPCNSGSLRLGV